MITAIVRYKLPASIGYDECRAHFHKIAPNFKSAKGLISKHFIWRENGTAGGVYQWESLVDAKGFYSGAWLKGILDRYGMYPEIEYFEVFAVTDNSKNVVEKFEDPTQPLKRRAS